MDDEMCSAVKKPREVSVSPKGLSINFSGIQAAFSAALEVAFENKDSRILRQVYESFDCNTDGDKKSPMDQAFREMLMLQLRSDVENIGQLITLSVDAVREEIASVTIPVVLLGDIFDAVTLDKCEQIFSFVEEKVSVWKEEIFFTSCKNNILRMCNDLLRRLSRAQNTVFCGRILLFLAKFFPFSERSGLNIVSEFNLDNVTEYGIDGKELDDALEDNVDDIPVKIDYNLYCKFWSLQDFFRNPNQCYNKAQWKMFQTHTGSVLEAFASFKLEEHRGGSSTNGFKSNGLDAFDDVTDNDNTKIDTVKKSEQFFAKFLTNPKLLALQMSDSNFRRSVLVQFLILFQYLQLTVKFKTDSYTLTSAQTDFITETETSVYRLLEETPPNGKRFAETVRHMLVREEMWNNWKNDGCKEFKKPELEESVASSKPPAKRLRRTLGESLRDNSRNGKFFLGNEVLTRLWNLSPDNLQACKSEERNFLPSVEQFLETPREKNDCPFEWRALRLLARQSPHFFTLVNTQSYKISDYLECVRRKLARDKVDISKSTSGIASAGVTTDNSIMVENSETTELQETVALQEQEPDQEEDEEPVDIEKVDDDQNTHCKPITATHDNIMEIAPLIGDDWKKLGKKLGYTSDELLYFETEHTENYGGCIAMLLNWFADDDDASLDNWAYILEGLEMNTAATAVKALIEKANSSSDKAQI